MEILKALALSIVALILFIVLGSISFIIEIVVAIKTKSTKRIAMFFMSFAVGLDQIGNSTCRWIFNKAFLTNESIERHGAVNRTVSNILGNNLLSDTLTGFGKFMGRLLSVFDPDHLIKSASEGIRAEELSYKMKTRKKYDT